MKNDRKSENDELRKAVEASMWRSIREDDIRRAIIIGMSETASRERRNHALQLARAINGETS